ncbi:MAG: DUF2141 domain-containing protein [Alphaproteobacteria bacterium]
MKLGFLCAAMFAFAAGLLSTAQAATIKVEVRDVASARGNVLVALCDEATFLKRCAHSAMAQARRGEVAVTFVNIPPGRYAVMAYHDENGDRRLNRSMIGIPTEGAGFSRNAVGTAGPPKFSDAAVNVAQADATLSVDLVYY